VLDSKYIFDFVQLEILDYNSPVVQVFILTLYRLAFT